MPASHQPASNTQHHKTQRNSTSTQAALMAAHGSSPPTYQQRQAAGSRPGAVTPPCSRRGTGGMGTPSPPQRAQVPAHRERQRQASNGGQAGSTMYTPAAAGQVAATPQCCCYPHNGVHGNSCPMRAPSQPGSAMFTPTERGTSGSAGSHTTGASTAPPPPPQQAAAPRIQRRRTARRLLAGDGTAAAAPPLSSIPRPSFRSGGSGASSSRYSTPTSSARHSTTPASAAMLDVTSASPEPEADADDMEEDEEEDEEGGVEGLDSDEKEEPCQIEAKTPDDEQHTTPSAATAAPVSGLRAPRHGAGRAGPRRAVGAPPRRRVRRVRHTRRTPDAGSDEQTPRLGIATPHMQELSREEVWRDGQEVFGTPAHTPAAAATADVCEVHHQCCQPNAAATPLTTTCAAVVANNCRWMHMMSWSRTMCTQRWPGTTKKFVAWRPRIRTWVSQWRDPIQTHACIHSHCYNHAAMAMRLMREEVAAAQAAEAEAAAAEEARLAEEEALEEQRRAAHEEEMNAAMAVDPDNMTYEVPPPSRPPPLLCPCTPSSLLTLSSGVPHTSSGNAGAWGTTR